MYGMLNMGGLSTQKSELSTQDLPGCPPGPVLCFCLLFSLASSFFLFTDFSNPQAPTLERDVLLKLVSDTGARGKVGEEN